MVREGLQPAVYRMKSVAGVRRWHDPFMVWFMQCLVNPRQVQPSMDNIDPEIGENNEERELKEVVPYARAFRGGIVELGESVAFGHEERDCEDGHHGKGGCGLLDFIADLVFQEFGVIESRFVKDKDVGEGCKYEIDY